MKTPWILLLIAVALTGCGTKNATTQETATTETAPTETASATDGQPQCYALITASDTVRLSMTQRGSEVTGTMLVQLSEKDRNTGTLQGQMRGDTLLANYTFQSEGQESVREVVFLAKDGGFVEGYGPVQEQNGKMVFTPNAPLTFEMDRVLKKTTCLNE